MRSLCLGSRCGRFAPACSWELLRQGHVTVRHLISKIFPLDRGLEAFEDLDQTSALKVLLEMGVEAALRRHPASWNSPIQIQACSTIKNGVIGNRSYPAHYRPNPGNRQHSGKECRAYAPSRISFEGILNDGVIKSKIRPFPRIGAMDPIRTLLALGSGVAEARKKAPPRGPATSCPSALTLWPSSFPA